MEQDGNLILTFWCYHGTLAESAEKIMQSKEFLYKWNSTHWLGNGIYFFVDDFAKAKWWSRECARNIYKETGLKPATACIRVKVNTSKKDLLNLDTESDCRILEKYTEDFRQKLSSVTLKDRDITLTTQQIRTMVFDYLVKNNGYKAIKHTFSNTKITYQNINKGLSPKNEQYLRNNGTQLAIFDQSLIDFKTLIICN
ncbi:hypothetical protein [Peptococcus simiae]|uniref:hypothetical protein n=1 Tax=Peptococcus simiae TaxID=1643805 RepID=UPI00398142F2